MTTVLAVQNFSCSVRLIVENLILNKSSQPGDGERVRDYPLSPGFLITVGAHPVRNMSLQWAALQALLYANVKTIKGAM